MDIVSLSDRPDLIEDIFDDRFKSLWPAFISHSETAKLYFAPWMFDQYRDYAFAGLVKGRTVARIFTIGFSFDSPNRRELPDGGWDQAIRWGNEDKVIGRSPDALCALDITILPEMQGKGHAMKIIHHLKSVAKNRGLKHFFVPLRPSEKKNSPDIDLLSYISLKGDDGYPIDPWLRTHIRAGGHIMGIAPYSMTIVGTVAEWEKWTCQEIRSSGHMVVEGGLNPLYVSIEHNQAVYVEPNVWIKHPISTYSSY